MLFALWCIDVLIFSTFLLFFVVFLVTYVDVLIFSTF